MSKKWTAWIMDLHLLGKQPIPRRYVRNDSPPVSTTIHGYCDASVMAYRGVVYIRTMHQDSSVSVTMISAKIRLAPLHSVTIPCLELCGALTLAKLLSSVVKDVQLDITQVYAWTDSTIVLGWLRKAPTRLKVFVANRIMQIKELVHTMSWHHVNTRHNPADILSYSQEEQSQENSSPAGSGGKDQTGYINHPAVGHSGQT